MRDGDLPRNRSRTAAGRRIGPQAAAAAAVLLALTAACREQAAPDPVPPPAEPTKAKPAPSPPPPLGAPLGRAALLAAANDAASDYAMGRSPSAERPPLIGKRFEIRLPFGCEGPAPQSDSSQASWRYGPEGKTIRITVSPGDWTGTNLARELGGPQAFERIEGYWIPRPWIKSEGCPAVRTDPLQSGQPSPSPDTVGLVTLHEAGGSRLQGRGGRPYEVTLKAPEDGARPAPEGYRLLLSGRVTGFPDNRALRCRAASPDQRPVCILAVVIERVAIEDPAQGEVLGEWRN